MHPKNQICYESTQDEHVHSITMKTYNIISTLWRSLCSFTLKLITWSSRSHTNGSIVIIMLLWMGSFDSTPAFSLHKCFMNQDYKSSLQTILKIRV